MNKFWNRRDQIRSPKNKGKYLVGYHIRAVNLSKQSILSSLQNHQTLTMNKFAKVIEASSSKAKLSRYKKIKLSFLKAIASGKMIKSSTDAYTF